MMATMTLMVIKWDLYGDYIYMDTYIIIHCICISLSNYSLGKSYIYHIITYNDCIYLCKFHHDLTSFDHLALESWLGFGKSSPFMAARFRLVKYYNLPRYIYIIAIYVIKKRF